MCSYIFKYVHIFLYIFISCSNKPTWHLMKVKSHSVNRSRLTTSCAEQTPTRCFAKLNVVFGHLLAECCLVAIQVPKADHHDRCK